MMRKMLVVVLYTAFAVGANAGGANAGGVNADSLDGLLTGDMKKLAVVEAVAWPEAVLLDGEGPVARALADALRDAGLAVIRALPLDRTEAARSAYAAEIELSNGRLRLKCKGVFAGDHDAVPLLSHGYAAVVQLVMETLGAPATDG